MISNNRDSGVGIDQYETLAAENEKLKFQLGDMIEKYQELFLNIKKIQEERQRERQAQIDMQKRQEQSINPFSIASGTSHPKGSNITNEGNEQSMQTNQLQIEKVTETQQKKIDDNRNQSGGEMGSKSKKSPPLKVNADAQTSPMIK